MSVIAIGASSTRTTLLSEALGTTVDNRPTLTDESSDGQHVRRGPETPAQLIAVYVDSIASSRASGEATEREQMRSAVVSIFMPMRDLLPYLAEWCRIVWVVSAMGIDGRAEPVQCAVENWALGAMRASTRELANKVSTAALVVDGYTAEQEQLLANTVAMLAEPESSFYTGQVLQLRAAESPRRVANV